MPPAPASDRMAALRRAGVAAWVDMLSREVLDSGQFERWIFAGGISGATSNPTIFATALAAESNCYDAELGQLVAAGCTDSRDLFLALAIADVGRAADLLAATHHASGGDDGFVSIECTPDLADDAQATVTQALDIWRRLNRSNVMVKVPATDAGVIAIRQLTASGVNVNVTLLFSQERYSQVLAAYTDGLADRVAEGLPVAAIRSVASFFVSRVDSKIDSRLPEEVPLRGRVAIANARLAYDAWITHGLSPRWQGLAAEGAQPQRLLWASTATKNRAYRDVLYVEELIGPDTINTMPPATRDAFAHHGRVATTLPGDLDTARADLERLGRYGVDLATATTELEAEGIASFSTSYRELLAVLDRKVRDLTGAPVAPLTR
ncbi:MAG: transaldolase [Acidimicrobiales bacterium]